MGESTQMPLGIHQRPDHYRHYPLDNSLLPPSSYFYLQISFSLVQSQCLAFRIQLCPGWDIRCLTNTTNETNTIFPFSFLIRIITESIHELIIIFFSTVEFICQIFRICNSCSFRLKIQANALTLATKLIILMIIKG